ncbi:MAG: thioredoxin [Fuerstiella sp.]
MGHAAVDFQEAIASKDGIVLVDFWATWCPPCKSLAPELEQLAADYPGQITIVKIDVDIASDIAQSYEISSIPDMRIFKAGEQIDTIIGYKPAADIASHLGL